MGEIRVAIADDNERILELLGEIVSSDKDLSLVGWSAPPDSRRRICAG